MRAIHIHHGLSPNADQWLAHCQQICQQLNIPLLTKKVQVNKKNGIEQGAREARYQAIFEERLPNEVVATAHHLQDQTETFFLALKRSSGVKGLSAMQIESELFGMRIFRPLLNAQKENLETYLRAEKLTWIEDESNVDNRYERNFLRNQILPKLRERWAFFDQAVQTTAQLCYNQQQLLNELLADEFVQRYNENDRTFNVSHFAKYSVNKQNALLRMWLEELGEPLLGEQALAILSKEVIFAPKDANPQYVLRDKTIRRYQNKLYLVPKLTDVSDFCAELRVGQILENLTALWRVENHEFKSILPLTDEQITVRFGYSGTVKLHAQDLNRDIKKVWQKLGVPVWQRTRIPLIFYGDRLKSAVGFFENFGE